MMSPHLLEMPLIQINLIRENADRKIKTRAGTSIHQAQMTVDERDKGECPVDVERESGYVLGLCGEHVVLGAQPLGCYARGQWQVVLCGGEVLGHAEESLVHNAGGNVAAFECLCHEFERLALCVGGGLLDFPGLD